MKLVYMKCVNDDDGNPRRGWLLKIDGKTIFFDERYRGHDAVPPKYRSLIETADCITVTPSQYADARKFNCNPWEWDQCC